MNPLALMFSYLMMISFLDEISSYPQPWLNLQRRSLQRRNTRFWPHRSIAESFEMNPTLDQLNIESNGRIFTGDYMPHSPSFHGLPNHRYRNDDTVRYPNQRGSAYDMSRHALDSVYGMSVQARAALPNHGKSYLQQGPDINFEENPSFDFPSDQNCSESKSEQIQSQRNSANSPPIVNNKGKWIPKTSHMNCPSTSTFCDAIQDYPEHDIKSSFHPRLNSFLNFFGVDEEYKGGHENAVATRLALSPSHLTVTDEDPLCEAETVIQFPKVAKNRDNAWVFVVNVRNYTQGVKVEKCRKENVECSIGLSTPLGQKTVCRQKFAYRKLVAIDHDGSMISDTFAMPSCCTCMIKRLGASLQSRSIKFRS